VKFLCEQCKAKYQIADDKVAGKTVRMKCRKCGHLIEVRAAVTETSVASVPPAAPGPGAAPAASKPPQRPAPARATSLAASLAATRPPASRPERPQGALAGAFKSTVQREDEISAPFDMSEISPADDWYVAVNGVPVGPIRIAEVRRKAALGAVTEDSLVWQEGLDEWRPLRTFPELAAMVREAAAGGRSVTPPPSEARGSLVPPPRGTSMRPLNPSHPSHPSPVAAARVTSQRPNPAVAPVAARSNVVPITSRLATAEKLDEPTHAAMQRPSPFVPPAALSQAAPVAAAEIVAPAAVPLATASISVSADSTRDRRGGPPWIVIGMLAAFIAFGSVSAVLVFGQRNAPAPAPVAAPVGPTREAPPAAASAATLPPSPAAPADLVASAPTASAPPPTKGGLGAIAGPRMAAAAAPSASPSPTTGRSLDLHGLSGNTVAPTDEMGSEGPKATGQCFTEGQVQQVMGQHSVAIRRTCWERGTSAKTSANISVSLTIGPDGSTQGVSATGDDPAVAHCVENDVRNWRFPSMGCSQKIAVPFKFVRQ
jgi:predicted Zn finger-like uncharacterized protein